jgi:uncharacterized protein DUF3108
MENGDITRLQHSIFKTLIAFLGLTIMLWAQSPAAGTAAASGAPHVQPPSPGYEFSEGRTFTYKGEWRIWTAGTATLRISREGENYRVNATADDSGIVARLFPVHDRFQSDVDPKTFCSLQLIKHTEEGFRKRDTTIRFDQAGKKSLLDEVNLKNNEKKHQENPTPGCVTDVIAGLLYVGSLPLKPGDVYQVPLNDGGRTSNVKLTVDGREQIKTDAGVFQTIRVVPEGDATLMRKGKVWLWYTDDAHHTLVQMKGKLFWGTLVLSLQKTEAPPAKK